MLEGVAAVLLDNHDAMRQLVQHLIQTHGKSRIAFVRGPQGNEEAEDRYRGYLRALFDHELTPDESLVVPGDLDRASGVVAAQLLLTRGVDFDAVVVSSDRAASGVLDELRAQGLDVPGSVAVGCCDDSPEARDMFARFVSDVRGKTQAAFTAQTERLLRDGPRTHAARRRRSDRQPRALPAAAGHRARRTRHTRSRRAAR